ncbi:hypothetical protein QEJ31_13830 [Pigmentibacter sp. JX0631]|uniref:hypothetical protein n=1 Tax=Pigmentibacter sp. JX0631 TaxID=2976982 RepID=UPI002468A605|nr:hypothetical protein [Pigmentibacter sp. JX0631]WGL59606.1 hypothetical protein QEJ31_13830 [Pigmentibacter sp. JX0631]
MKNNLNNEEYILSNLLSENITKEFLNELGTNISSNCLAKLVIEFKKISNSPKQLNQIISQADFPVFDVVGTGGIGRDKLNTSTLTGLFASCLGFQIVKHGGRSSSGKIGAVDFLEKNEFPLEKMFENAEEYFRATNFLFLPAAYTYPIFAKSSPIRKEIKGPTVFNLLGPLLNPINVKGKLIGAFNFDIALKLADTCSILNETAFIVSSFDQFGYLDEASPYAKTAIYFCKDKKYTKIEIDPIELCDSNRIEIFSNSSKVTEELLSSIENVSTNYAKNLLSYNLSILHVLNEFSFGNSKINLDENQIKNKIILNYKLIKNKFSSLSKLVTKKIEQIKNLSPLHPRSPILVNHSFDLPKLKIIEKKVQSFKNKEKLLLAEIKLNNPKSTITDKLSLEDRLEAYKMADGISFITHPSFSGSLEILRKIRELTDKPILAKDFITEKYQIKNLVLAGANGILLLQDFISESKLIELVNYCNELNVSAFVESSFFLPKIGDFYILNSRSLFSLEENKHFRNFLLNFNNENFDTNKIIIASNIDEIHEAQTTLKIFKGCIIGTALMNMNNPVKIKNFISEIKNSNYSTKFCGAKTLFDLQNALTTSSELIGINLIPESKKFVGPNNLKEMLPLIQMNQEKICFITRNDVDLECLKIIDELSCNEHAYSFPILDKSKYLISSSTAKYLNTAAFLLDGSSPGKGIVENYLVNIKNNKVPTFVSNGLNLKNYKERFQEALEKNWKIIGIDCSSAICNEESTNTKSIFSIEKMFEMEKLVKGIQHG